MSNRLKINTTFDASVTSNIVSNYVIQAKGISNGLMDINPAISVVTQSINTLTWTMINTGSVGVVQSVYVKNLSSSSLLDLAQDNAGSNKVSLVPYDNCVVMFPSGSQGYWAKYIYVSGSIGTGSVQVNSVGY